MSGGVLTDYKYDLYLLNEWADRIEKENTLLAQMMRDLYDLLTRYDKYLSDDIGKDAIEEAWKTFRSKWIEIDTDSVTEILFEKCLDMVNSAIRGHHETI